MQLNVGGVDRFIRFVLGVVLISAFFFLEGGLRYIGILGIVFLFTSLVRWCPLYLPFKINTAGRQKK